MIGARAGGSEGVEGVFADGAGPRDGSPQPVRKEARTPKRAGREATDMQSRGLPED